MKIEMSLLRNAQGFAFLSYGFRPFFLAGAIYSGLAVAIWIPVYFGEVTLHTAFAPLDWHIHEMLFGFLPAVIAGFLLTAIPNWTGRPPVRGNLLLLMVVVWVLGRVAVACSGEVGWRAAMLVDVSFLLLAGAVAAREVLAARNFRNMRVVALVLLLFACNVAFHVEAHVQGAAGYSVRAGVAAIVLLVSVIAGRIVPAFTRIWLMRRPQGAMPIPFSRFDGIAVLLGAHPGLGKSRLIQELKLHCQLAHVPVLSASSTVEGMGAYDVVRQVLQAGLPLADGALREPAERLLMQLTPGEARGPMMSKSELHQAVRRLLAAIPRLSGHDGVAAARSARG